MNETLPCPHHWTIAPPNGPTSRGVCALCGAEREFRNSFVESHDWSNVVTFPRAMWDADLQPVEEVNDITRDAWRSRR